MRTPKVMRQKEEGIICRLMARSGRLPSGFDYTLIIIIINSKIEKIMEFTVIICFVWKLNFGIGFAVIEKAVNDLAGIFGRLSVACRQCLKHCRQR